jgi:hypothetical protein
VLFEDARTALLREVGRLRGRVDLDEAFAAWAVAGQDDGRNLRNIAEAASQRKGASRSYRDVAILGFAADAGVIESPQESALQEDLEWLAGREPFIFGIPAAFCTDSVALLGTALGARSICGENRDPIARWMTRFIKASYEMRGIHDWQRCLMAAAQRAARAAPDLPVPQEDSVADVRVALRARGALAISAPAGNPDEELALGLWKSEREESLEPIRAAIRLSAWNWIRRKAPVVIPARMTTGDVGRLLHGVSAALRRWTWEEKPRTKGAQARKWHVDNEYHVQSLLWFLLAPIFPDLTDEVSTPPVGQMQPRADLCVPSLKLIVEAKFIRLGGQTQFKKTIEQIAADSELYLTAGSPYSEIIAFVWDDSRQSEQHDVLVRGLKQIDGITDAIVVSRPGTMGP